MESVSLDLFEWAGKHYLIMVDRYSSFPFVAEFSNLKTGNVVRRINKWFLDWGYPARIRTDGGPQF